MDTEVMITPVEDGEEYDEVGSSIADMTDEGGVGDDNFIEGARQLSLLAGGEEPTSASMRLRGGSVPVEGEFEKGDTLRLSIECRVAEVHFVDRVDPSGFVIGTERRHVARVENVQRI